MATHSEKVHNMKAKKTKTIRLPEEIIKNIQAQANREGRSFNNMIVRVLTTALATEKQA
jgi:predicted HicB family RNase H-like nuclease